MSRHGVVPLPPRQRSAVTNGTIMLAGVNGRSALARRYKDLVSALSADLGDELDEGERLQIRNVAALQLHSEALTAGLVRGEAVDPEAITRATNGATRALAALRRRKVARKPAAPSLGAYLEARLAGGAK